jgi:hypothetical protein
MYWKKSLRREANLSQECTNKTNRQNNNISKVRNSGSYSNICIFYRNPIRLYKKMGTTRRTSYYSLIYADLLLDIPFACYVLKNFPSRDLSHVWRPNNVKIFVLFLFCFKILLWRIQHYIRKQPWVLNPMLNAWLVNIYVTKNNYNK